MQQQVEAERLYGLDWLRIGALGLLMLYHVGMFFGPWEWHVKTAQPLDWLELPMMAVNPWRLSLLFVVAGVASRMLLGKLGASSAFAASRSTRLLVPLAAGIALFVAPQPWAELRSMGAYSGGFWEFWQRDYFRFGDINGVILPTWNHLWFLAYLWVYTMVLALLSRAPARAKAHLQRAFDRCFRGRRLFVLPILFLAAMRVLVFPRFGETHALVDDLYAHSVYGFAFFFGVGLARSGSVWKCIEGKWRVAVWVAAGAYALTVALDLTIPGDSGELELFVRRVCRAVYAWSAIVGLLGFARLHLHRDGPLRRYLTDAIFPYYIAHQTIIIVVGYSISSMRLGTLTEFAIIILATVAGCGVVYEIGRRLEWLRPLIGLRINGLDRRPMARERMKLEEGHRSSL